MRYSPGQTGAKLRRKAIKAHVLLDERAARRLRRLRWKRVGWALVLMAAIAGVVLLYRSPLLRVQDVQVTGTVNMDAAAVAGLAGLEGQSLLRVDLDKAQSRIQSQPLVKSVTVTKHWPQTVRIEVTERTPWGFWRTGDKDYPVDMDGYVLPDVPMPEGSPVILAQTSQPLQPGDRVDPAALALAQSMMGRVPEALGLQVRSVESTAEKGLALVTDAGYRVVLGDGQNIDYKLAVWKVIEEDLGREAMAGHVLDLRFGDHPSFQ